jgi:hypothetical protein
VCDDPGVPSDEQITEVIERLEQEREALRSREGGDDPTLEADAARVEEIRVELDQLWDLLRQRRALRDAGQDPDQAHERSPDIVERYWQ